VSGVALGALCYQGLDSTYQSISQIRLVKYLDKD
jgi:hypothetical protein